MALRPHKTFVIPFGKGEELLVSRLRAEESPAEYIKALISLDIESPEMLRFKHENWNAMSNHTAPYKLTMRLYWDTDLVLLDKLSRMESMYSYIKDLIYWDIGIDPDTLPHHKNRGKRGRRKGITKEEYAAIVTGVYRMKSQNRRLDIPEDYFLMN